MKKTCLLNFKGVQLIVPFVISLFTINTHAQLNATTIGSAIDRGANCFTITPDSANQSGGVWYDNPINFSNNFTIYYQNNFGNKDADGADGMALVFKGNSTAEIGNSGGGVGFAGISTSLTVEFDTWQNTENADPAGDHVAILRDGIPNHSNAFNNLAGPVQASATSLNIEDGTTHEIKITWNASAQVFTVFFDCIERLRLTLDIKNTIFSGDDTVFFGFVGSTGGFSNVHELCFNSISFVDNLNLADSSICLGESIILNAAIPSGTTYSWSPTVGVSDPNRVNPTFSPTTTTTYTVTIGDVCGETSTEDVTITVLPLLGTPTFNPVPDICSGDVLPPLPTASNEGITGTWTPALNNTITTTYTFTPDADQCATPQNLTITVNPNTQPVFHPVSPICSGDLLAPLPTVSNNGIIGTWSPALNNTTTTTYTFTPNAGICALSAQITIVVNPILTPTFDQVLPICSGDILTPLPTLSNEGIMGTWSPALNNTATTTYTFTPELDECATIQNLTIIVNPNAIPEFTQIPAICAGDILLPLPTTSNNGISGSWTPTINNTITTTYTFTPDSGFCPLSASMTIQVNENPNVNLNNDYFLCLTSTGAITNPITIDTGLSTSNYNFTWFLNGVSISGENEGSLIPLVEGNYDVQVQDATTLCENRVSTTVTVLVEPDFEARITSDVFLDNQIIEVFPQSAGVFEYRLDEGPWQDSPIFENVTLGEHIVYVRDIRGCIESNQTVFVIGYPKFFTPNGDTINDTWNIIAPNSTNGFLASAELFIFDRYGKLLKQLDPNGVGWTGLYKGRAMPSNDYWFTITYTEPNTNIRKQFRAHFTLKR